MRTGIVVLFRCGLGTSLLGLLFKDVLDVHCKNRLVEMTNLNWLSQTH